MDLIKKMKKNKNVTIMLACIVLIFLFIFSRKKIYQKFTQQGWIKSIIDEVYIIALPERKESALENLQKLEIIPNVYNAFLKKNIDRKELVEQGFLESSSKLTDAKLACHYSHTEVLKKFLRSNHKTCLIFEDDINCPFSKQELRTELSNLMNNSKQVDYDIINLGRCYDNCNTVPSKIGNLVKVLYPRCMHSYIVNRKGAEKIINLFVPCGDLPGDEVLAKANKLGLLNYYGSDKNLFIQNRSEYGSTIGNGGPLPMCTPR